MDVAKWRTRPMPAAHQRRAAVAVSSRAIPSTDLSPTRSDPPDCAILVLPGRVRVGGEAMDEDRVRGRIALLREVASRSGEDRESLLDAHPELYADQYFPSLAAAVRESPDVGALRAVLDELRGRVTSWDNREADFVIGSAPYEILWLRVRDGRLDQKAAERAAAAIPAPVEAEAYVRALTTLSRRMVPAAAVSLLGILRAAIAARPGGAFADDAGPDAELQFVRSVSQLLVTEADGRLAATALEAGEAVLDGARKRGLRDLELDALLVLGSLCTNPYSGHRSSRNLEVELWQWQHRFWDSHRDELVDLEPEAWQMPPAAASHIHGAEY